VDPHELETVWIGTTHYYWIMRMLHRGRDVHDELVRRFRSGGPEVQHPFCDRLSAAYGTRILFPDDSHAIEFYPFLAQLPDPKRMPYGLEKHPHYIFGGREGTTWKEPLGRAAQLKAMAKSLAGIEIPDAPSDPMTGEGLGVLIDAMAQGRRHVHIVNIPNRGSVPNLPDYAVLEMEGVTDSRGVRGVSIGEAPVALAGMLQKRIAWQELVADAAVKGDRRLALHALLTDEMAIRPELAGKMLDELLAASKDYLPQFRKARSK
jgi:alpha-galactosidase/6-phospho-beta-glucosidase family protein